RPADWIKVVVNALLVLHGKVTSDHVAPYICPHDRDAITPEMVELEIMMAVTRPDWIISNAEAGRLANLVLDELLTIQQADGIVLTMHPHDESSELRKERRAVRARKNAAERQRRCRAKRSNVAGGVTVSTSCDRDRDTPATSQRSQVIAAVANGACTVGQIITVTGLPSQTVRSWLTRLVKAGFIYRVTRGRYAQVGVLS